MRSKLQALIDYTGLSNQEAASIVGISHESLSRKLAGKPRYDVREDELIALTAVANWQDAQVKAILSRIAQLTAQHGEAPEEICMVQYRRSDDMLDPSGPPASAQRMIVARLAREAGECVVPVSFDPVDYHGWRGARIDTHALRAEWAAQAKFDYRLGAKLGGKYPYAPEKSGSACVGWAIVQIDRAREVLDAGEDTL